MILFVMYNECTFILSTTILPVSFLIVFLKCFSFSSNTLSDHKFIRWPAPQFTLTVGDTHNWPMTITWGLYTISISIYVYIIIFSESYHNIKLYLYHIISLSYIFSVSQYLRISVSISYLSIKYLSLIVTVHCKFGIHIDVRPSYCWLAVS